MTSKKREKKPAQPSAVKLVKASGNARRLLIALRTTCVVGLKAANCGISPSAVGPAEARAPSPSITNGTAATFKDCPQHFADGKFPITPAAPKLSELCFDAFAVLHSGNTKTPIYVAQRQNRQIL